MKDSEYVRIKISDIPAEFIDEYNLQGRDRNGWIYFESAADAMACHSRASWQTTSSAND